MLWSGLGSLLVACAAVGEEPRPLAPVASASSTTPQAKALPVRPASDLAQVIREQGDGRPLVLHFWATWCVACVDEFRRLAPALNALPARGFRVALVSVDEPDTRARAPEMLARFGLGGLPALVLDAPSPEPVARALGEPKFNGVLPATFLFDRRGKKTRAFLGSASAEALEAAVRAASTP
jgi:thiol:disulfide interchange protein DsbD